MQAAPTLGGVSSLGAGWGEHKPQSPCTGPQPTKPVWRPCGVCNTGAVSPLPGLRDHAPKLAYWRHLRLGGLARPGMRDSLPSFT